MKDIEFLVGDICYVVSFDVIEAEPRTMVDPGCAADVELYKVESADGITCLDMYDVPEEDLEELHKLALEFTHNKEV